MKKWEAKLPGGKKIVFESDTPREYMRDVGHEEYALTQIAQFQSANVSTVRHGKWEWDTEDIYRCSNCAEKIHVKEVMGRPAWGYCPNCGCRMDGGDMEGEHDG